MRESGAGARVGERFAESSASVLLDLLRALAASAVVVSHWRNIFFVDYGELGRLKGWLLLPYLVSSGGHEAVVVFFVLSGFFVGGAVFRALDQGRWEWRDYLVRRGLRLWVVLLPALVLCAGWDHAGSRLGHAPVLYHGGGSTHLLGDVGASSTPGIFLANLLFLQTVVAPTFGSDSALWSLANEFWYYVLFPLGLFALKRETRAWVRVWCALLFVGGAFLVGWKIVALFPIWLLGVALFKVKAPVLSGRSAGRLRWAAALVYAGLLAMLSKMHRVPEFAADYLLAAITGVFLWILLSARGPAREVPGAGVIRGAARFSYSLYALHLPVLVFCAALSVGERRWLPSLVHVLAGVGVLGAVYGYAYGVAWLTEFRTDDLRGRLEGFLGLRGPASPLSSDPKGNKL